ncbi:predicted protein [Lichtheimia corymbifera JMRC:FSU:9682]|uniref:Uncharacterized protein n=1 Tax=Lichtheimia corymbifera JMRC:FSU:9682 TaxID=1263082 RepID=A0A068RV21_9FUNG|nr:predicted protein [Lichtheimia corymbifera JMRC:FSU:9682]
MKRGVFNRTKLLGGVERTLGASFTINFANLKIHPISPPASSKKIQEVDHQSTLAGGDFAKSRNGHHDRETSTQDTFGHDEQLCSIQDPTFHCRIFIYGHLCVLHMCKRAAI